MLHDHDGPHPAAPSEPSRETTATLDFQRIDRVLALAVMQNREDAQSQRERTANGKPSREFAQKCRAEADELDRDADAIAALQAQLPALLAASSTSQRLTEERDEARSLVEVSRIAVNAALEIRDAAESRTLSAEADRDAWKNAHAEAVGHMERWAPELDAYRAVRSSLEALPRHSPVITGLPARPSMSQPHKDGEWISRSAALAALPQPPKS
jgi:hypothetical protein